MKQQSLICSREKRLEGIHLIDSGKGLHFASYMLFSSNIGPARYNADELIIKLDRWCVQSLVAQSRGICLAGFGFSFRRSVEDRGFMGREY